MTNRIRTTIAASLALGALGSGVALAPSAFAQGGGGGVRAAGTCSAHGVWKLKAKADDGRLEVEAQVDVNRAGQHWRWSIAQDGRVARAGTAKTTAPSGSFSVHRLVADKAGKHRITFRAVNAANGNICRGSVRA